MPHQWQLDRVLEHETNAASAVQPSGFEERCGKGPKNKTAKQDIDLVKKHINSFPQYISHYCRCDTQHVKYLPQNLNLAMMYRMYKTDTGTERPVSENVYRNVFNTQLNLKFQKPKKDTCTKCDLSLIHI